MEQKIFDNHLVFERLARENGRCGGGGNNSGPNFSKIISIRRKGGR